MPKMKLGAGQRADACGEIIATCERGTPVVPTHLENSAPTNPSDDQRLLLNALAELFVDEVIRLRSERGFTARDVRQYFHCESDAKPV